MEQKPPEECCGTWVVAELWDNVPSVPGHAVLAKALMCIALNEPSQHQPRRILPGGGGSREPLPHPGCSPCAILGGMSGWVCFFLTFILLAVSLPNSEDPEDLRYWAWCPCLAQPFGHGVCMRVVLGTEPCMAFGPRRRS